MARIEGVDLPRNKRVEVGLTYLFGICLTRSQEILSATKVSPDTRIKDLSESDVAAIREYISKHYTVEGDLRREVQLNIKRLIEIGSCAGRQGNGIHVAAQALLFLLSKRFISALHGQTHGTQILMGFLQVCV